jgi:hypothetical protein
LADGEEPQKNVARHKSHFNKAMFLGAAVLPWKSNRCPDMDGQNTGEYSANFDGVDDFNKWLFDGEVGIYPLVEESAANRNSSLRPAGILVPTAVSMTGQLIKSLYLRSIFWTLQGNVHGK